MNILEARELRFQKTKQLIKNEKTWIVVKANAISAIRTHPLLNSLVIIAYTHLITHFTIVDHAVSYDAEGLVLYLCVDQPAVDVKQVCMSIENHHPIGRLLDLDVVHQHQNLSRLTLNQPMRRCYLCDEVAMHCVREKTHSTQEIVDFSITSAKKYVQSSHGLSVLFGFTCELTRMYTYGCVGITHSGSHQDMDFFDFLKSVSVLVPMFDQMSDETTRDFSLLRDYGKAMETKMFEATHGKNTHKGAIFLYLFAVSAEINCVGVEQKIKFIQHLAKNLVDDFKGSTDTYGLFASKAYSIQSIRHMAMEGLSDVYRKILPLFKEGYDEHRVMATIISMIDDTTTMKRSDLATLRYVQSWAKQSKHKEDLSKLNDYYMMHQLSSGGCADVFALSCYLALREDWL